MRNLYSNAGMQVPEQVLQNHPLWKRITASSHTVFPSPPSDSLSLSFPAFQRISCFWLSRHPLSAQSFPKGAGLGAKGPDRAGPTCRPAVAPISPQPGRRPWLRVPTCAPLSCRTSNASSAGQVMKSSPLLSLPAPELASFYLQQPQVQRPTPWPCLAAQVVTSSLQVQTTAGDAAGQEHSRYFGMSCIEYNCVRWPYVSAYTGMACDGGMTPNT